MEEMMIRIAIAISIIALIGGCSTDKSQPWLVNAHSLTLKMQETEIEGKPAVVMLLCEQENTRCMNPLRDNRGEHFYFHNHANLYNQKVQETGKGQKIKMALLGITMVATAAGAFLYIRSDAWRVRITEIKDALSELRLEKKSKSGIELEKIEGEIQTLKLERGKLEAVDKYVAPTYWVALGISALGANALAFAPGIADDTLWQDNKRLLADLFIHGNAIKVTKDELVDLFTIVTQQVPATLDIAVQSYLFSI